MASRSPWRTGTVVALLFAAQAVAHAQRYPSKPIRMVLPFLGGSGSDIVGRALGQKLAEQLGENVVPDNRSGAGGNVGLAAAAKSAPDGYTLLVSTPAIVISPSMYRNPGFDPVKDFAPIARLAMVPNVVLVNPTLPAKTLRQFVELARSQPGKYSFGSGGPGTTNHLANELLKSLEKIDILHIPYKGANLATLALIGGEVDEVIGPLASALPQIRAGKVRALAVLSEQRIGAAPDIPTSKESGVDNFVLSTWYGLFAPAATPGDIIARLHRETVKAMEDPLLRERFTAAGIEVWLGTPAQLLSMVRSESARYATIIKQAGLRAD